MTVAPGPYIYVGLYSIFLFLLSMEFKNPCCQPVNFLAQFHQ